MTYVKELQYDVFFTSAMAQMEVAREHKVAFMAYSYMIIISPNVN